MPGGCAGRVDEGLADEKVEPQPYVAVVALKVHGVKDPYSWDFFQKVMIKLLTLGALNPDEIFLVSFDWFTHGLTQYLLKR